MSFPSPEWRVLHSDHLMFFVMGEGGRVVSCDLFGHCRELMMVSGVVSDFLFLVALTSLVCLTFVSLEVTEGGEGAKGGSWLSHQLDLRCK